MDKYPKGSLGPTDQMEGDQIIQLSKVGKAVTHVSEDPQSEHFIL